MAPVIDRRENLSDRSLEAWSDFILGQHREKQEGPKQLELDFRPALTPQSFRLSDGHLIYVEHDGHHHIVDGDMDVYMTKRKREDCKIVVHKSFMQRVHYFESIGYTI